MIKLFSLKNAKKDGETTKSGTQKKSSAAQLRIQKGKMLRALKFIFCFTLTCPLMTTLKDFDISFFNKIINLLLLPFTDITELNLPKTCGTDFPDPDDLLNFKLIICPDEVTLI